MPEVEARLEKLEHRIGELEDINAIRRLHWAYGYYIDFNRAADVAQLFSKDGEVTFLSGVFKGHEGIFRLYGTWFQNLFLENGGEGPEFGFLLDHFQMQDIITVAPDRQTAKGRFRGMLFGGSHEQRKWKPEGVPLQFMEAGIYENDYVLEGTKVASIMVPKQLIIDTAGLVRKQMKVTSLHPTKTEFYANYRCWGPKGK